MMRKTALILVAMIILGFITSCRPEPTTEGNLLIIHNYTNGYAAVAVRKSSDPPISEVIPVEDGDAYAFHFDEKTNYVMDFYATGDVSITTDGVYIIDEHEIVDSITIDVNMTDKYFYEAEMFLGENNEIECLSRYK